MARLPALSRRSSMDGVPHRISRWRPAPVARREGLTGWTGHGFGENLDGGRYPFFLERVWRPLLSRAKLSYRPLSLEAAHLRDLAARGWRRHPVGAATARPREHRPNRRHLRACPS